MHRLMKKGSIFKSISFRVFASITAALLVFALLLGFIFMRLYRTTTQSYSSKQLISIGQSVSENLSNYLLDDNYEEMVGYLEMFRDMEDTEIWIVANPYAKDAIDSSVVTVSADNLDMQDEYRKIIDQACRGKSTLDTFYSDPHQATVMAFGSSLLNAENEICGAFLLVSSMSQMDELLDTGRRLIVFCAALGLIVSAGLALTLTGRITRPISRVRQVAQEMTEGNYTCKTGIEGTDEIADMARSVDMLSDKLLENETERENMEQMRRDFFANVSHELRTPITVVRAYTESLVDQVVPEDKIPQYYDRILSECKSMQRLVGDLLTLSKMQNPNFKIEKEPVNLIHVIDEVVKGAAALSEEKHIKIVMNRDRDTYMMMGDYERLRQMFMVIFDNAVKFSYEDSSIYVTMTTDASKKSISVSIRDEGVGISEEERPYIFEKFYKSKLRQNAKGTGLGLAIAKYVALKHDGSIDVRSNQGEGTEFIFTFTEVSTEELEAYEAGL